MIKRVYAYYLVCLLAAPTLQSCMDNLAIDTSDLQSKLVINGIIREDSVIDIRVSKTYSYQLGNENARLATDVSLTLFANGQPKGDLVPLLSDSSLDEGYQQTYRSPYRPKAGDRIRIEARCEGFETAVAETVLPTAPLIAHVEATPYNLTELKTNGYIGGGYGWNTYIPEVETEPFYRMLRLKVSLDAGAGGTGIQYFQIMLSQPESLDDFSLSPVSYPLIVITDNDPLFAKNPRNSIFDFFEDPEIFSYQNYPLFTNELFDNNQYTLEVSTTGFYHLKIEYAEDEDNPSLQEYVRHQVLNPPIRVAMVSLSPELYRFYKINKESDSGFSAIMPYISEPATTYTNVQNGLGIVGAVSYSYVEVETPPFPEGEERIPRYY